MGLRPFAVSVGLSVFLSCLLAVSSLMFAMPVFAEDAQQLAQPEGISQEEDNSDTFDSSAEVIAEDDDEEAIVLSGSEPQNVVKTVYIDLNDCEIDVDKVLVLDEQDDGSLDGNFGVMLKVSSAVLKSKYGLDLTKHYGSGNYTMDTKNFTLYYRSNYGESAASVPFTWTCSSNNKTYSVSEKTETFTLKANGSWSVVEKFNEGNYRLRFKGSTSQQDSFVGVNIMNLTRSNGVRFSGVSLAGDINDAVDKSKAKQSVTLKFRGETLVEGRDYIVKRYFTDSYGITYLTVTGIGIFCGFDAGIYKIKLSTASFSGSTRYDTCKQIVDAEASLGTYKGVIVASGEEGRFPDALCASGLSGLLNYPIVLVNGSGTTLDSYSKQALERLRASAGGKLDIVVVGGKSAVNDKIASQLGSYGKVSARLGGTTRYDTSLAIYNFGAKMNGGWSKSKVVIARGDGFADSLSISPYTTSRKTPVLIVPSDSKSLGNGLRAIVKGYKQTVVVGGNRAVSDQLYGEAKSLTGSAVRLSGETRYDTSAKIAEWEMEQGMGFSYLGFASGQNFPDSLASGFLQAKRNSVLLLVNSADALASDEAGYTGSLAVNRAVILAQVKKGNFAGTDQVCYFGGEAAISAKYRNSIQGFFEDMSWNSEYANWYSTSIPSVSYICKCNTCYIWFDGGGGGDDLKEHYIANPNTCGSWSSSSGIYTYIASYQFFNGYRYFWNKSSWWG